MQTEYIHGALQTENDDIEGIGERLIANQDRVLPALNKAILAMQELDYVVKKECFYGKKPKFYDAPLFTKQGAMTAQQEALLRSKAFVRLLHGFMGIGTEAGEGLEALAQYFQEGQLDKVNVGEELGDCFWYAAIIADECETSFEAEQKKNLDKLAARYKKKQRFSSEESINRDLLGERRILES